MAYIGNEPTSNFASVTKDLFSGDGSTVAFTLSKTATTNGVAVFVENVRQEPTIAYAVSGTTLTFTAAPVTSSGNNIYVLHHNAVASTANHPAAQDLTAVKGTFTGTVDINGQELILDADADTSITADTDDQIDIKVAGSDLAHITSTYAKLRGATPLVFGESNSTGTFQSISGEVGANNLLLRSYQSLTFKNGTSGSSLTDGTTALNIDSAGHVTMPLQPAFLVHPASNQSNIPIDAVADTIVFGTERFDLNGDFSSNTFTAPVTGKYQFNCQIWLGQVDSATTYYQINLMTSNKTYYAIIVGPAFAADGDYWTLSIPVLADMDASDTAYMSILVHNSGTAQTDISTNSTFSGYLVA